MTAKLIAHKDTNIISRTALADVATPEPTKTWTPVPHHEVVDAVEDCVKGVGFKFRNRGRDKFKLAMAPTGSKMFGVCDILIPGIDDDEDYGYSVGFRNSHNKTLALQVVLGQRVFVCDNLMMVGDIKVRREHTRFIDPHDTIRPALEKVKEIVEGERAFSNSLRSRKVLPDTGVAYLAEAVNRGSLPLVKFMDARQHWLESCGGDAEDIMHGGTLWAWQQVITHEWKNLSMMGIPDRSSNLYTQLHEIVS